MGRTPTRIQTGKTSRLLRAREERQTGKGQFSCVGQTTKRRQIGKDKSPFEVQTAKRDMEKTCYVMILQDI